VCKGCPHFSETEESFLSISLSVKSKKTIHQSFDAMIKGDILDGDNAYFCERCNKKVSAVKRVCLKKLPDHLILTLKRFEFDFEIMKKLKVNDYCEFPLELNLREYSQQYFRKKENPGKFEDEELIPDSYYEYTLQGVVIHIGTSDSGHYYEFVRERAEGGRWFEFNDTIVRPFDIDRLAE
jgi:ubiquitin carboxyl-terminal hydrolase 9/24